MRSVIYKNHKHNFDDVIKDWDDPCKAERRLSWKREMIKLALILKVRRELLEEVPKALKSAEVKAADLKRGQQSFI